MPGFKDNGRNKRTKANKLGVPIQNNRGYVFPKNWNWHKRVQFIAKSLKESIEYLHRSIKYDID